MPYRGVIFDLYGTLIDGWGSAEAERRGRELGTALGVPLEPFRAQLNATYSERATGVLGDTAQMLRQLCRRGDSDSAGDRFGFLRCAVPYRDLVPDLDQPRGDGRAHFADTGDTDTHTPLPKRLPSPADDKRSARGEKAACACSDPMP